MYYFIDLNNDDKIFGRPMDAESVSQSDKSNLEKNTHQLAHQNNEPQTYLKKLAYGVWKSYQAMRREDGFLRIGNINYGVVYDVYDDVNRRPESVAEHSFSTINLLELVGEKCGSFIEKKLIKRAKRFMQYHDLGETEHGDIPDNQFRNKEEADQSEYECLKERLKYRDSKIRKKILRDFKIYNQDPTKLTEKDRRFRDICKLTDKLDAILRGLIYESYGYKGNLYSQSNPKISENERKYAEIMQESSLVAIFTASFVANEHNCYFYPFFREILKAAVFDVRGHWFDNWDKKSLELHQLGWGK